MRKRSTQVVLTTVVECNLSDDIVSRSCDQLRQYSAALTVASLVTWANVEGTKHWRELHTRANGSLTELALYIPCRYVASYLSLHSQFQTSALQCPVSCIQIDDLKCVCITTGLLHALVLCFEQDARKTSTARQMTIPSAAPTECVLMTSSCVVSCVLEYCVVLGRYELLGRYFLRQSRYNPSVEIWSSL